MNYHDYHLRGYSVSDFGETVVLDLIYDYPNQPIRESQIEFTGVSLYHFIHTSGAIITEISSCPIDIILSEYATQIPEWNRQQSVTSWPGSVEEYKKKLEEIGLSGWRIDSAIGFQGFVIGKEATQKAEPSGSA